MPAEAEELIRPHASLGETGADLDETINSKAVLTVLCTCCPVVRRA